MNSSTHSACLMKIHLCFMKLSWKSFFILFIFHSKFHFIDLFFSNSSCCKWKHSATTLEVTIHVITFLQMLFRFQSHNDILVVLAYLDAVANEFICKQSERKGIHTNVYCYVENNMGLEANVLHSSARISSSFVWNVGSCSCVSSSQPFSPFHVKAIRYDRLGNASTESWSESVGLGVCELGRSAFSCMVTRRNPKDQDITGDWY